MELRTDLTFIARMIHSSAKVLDVGCGDGLLLKHLLATRQVEGRGIEISQENVTRCMKRGVSVIQGNADTDLVFYPSGSFDYVVSSQVIQATHNPKQVLSEMLRIGKYVILSLPNFGYWRNRWFLFSRGRMPVTKTLSYEWYETPNIHFCTLHDFFLLCEELGCTIEKSYFIGINSQPLYGGIRKIWPNIFAEQGVFLLRK